VDDGEDDEEMNFFQAHQTFATVIQQNILQIQKDFIN